ncbi:XRE family transcriptional regulator [Falsochrobactrum shanghaiense]|uniref:XRE family transcriptional regulator n=2 Tax=Falsochrobactrum shanghaiense TaxID=2201899 RepID=A0A316JFU2_9HYPH|nr:XRE family transcriptional regulator [Falsochrobactrum shanghaiense]
MDIDLDVVRPSFPSGPASVESINVGARVAQLRSDRGWTLQEAAKRTGVSFSTLSKIERQELSPTVTTLTKIARGLNMGLSQLLETARPSAITARRSISRSSEGSSTKTSTCDNMMLCNDLTNRKMTPIRTRVRARDISAYTEWASYNAEIFLVVMKGTLVIHSQGYAPTRLEEGDSIYYDASNGHLWVSEGVEDAVVVWVYAD